MAIIAFRNVLKNIQNFCMICRFIRYLDTGAPNSIRLGSVGGLSLVTVMKDVKEFPLQDICFYKVSMEDSHAQIATMLIISLLEMLLCKNNP